jgi:hypothetical protein
MAAAGEISPLILVDNQKVGRSRGRQGGVLSGINRTVAVCLMRSTDSAVEQPLHVLTPPITTAL